MKKINLKNKNHTSHIPHRTSDYRGITLIALVITIIVMLILAAVSITMAVNGGLFGYAKNASQETEKARDKELLMSALTGWGVEKYTGTKTLVQILSEEFGAANVTNNGDGTALVTMSSGNEYLVDESGNISVLDDEYVPASYLGKYVYHNGTKFLVYSEDGDVLTLTPMTFNNDYLLSGKYIIENGNKKSVTPSTEGALADSSHEEFEERIIGELNRECQKLFGTADGTTIAAVNAESGFFRERVLDSVVNSLGSTTINDEVLATADQLIEQYKVKYDVTNSTINTMIQTENLTKYIVYVVNYGLNLNLSQNEENQMAATLLSLNKGEITLEQIPEEQQMLFAAMQRLCKLLCFDNLQTYWLSSVEDEHYVVLESDFLDNNPQSLFDDPNYYYSCTYSLAPVLTLNKSLLRRTTGNNYEINL